MKPVHKALLAATVAVVGVVGLGAATSRTAHEMTLRLPDGSIEQIRYAGNQAPQIRLEGPTPLLAANAARLDPIGDLAADPWRLEGPFIALDRLSAALDQQAEALLQDAAGAGPGGLAPVEVSRLPPGVQGFSVVSTRSGDGVCTRSIQYRASGEGRPPQVTTRASGQCGGDGTGAAEAGDSAPLAHATPVAFRR